MSSRTRDDGSTGARVERCAERSAAAGEPLTATASTASSWLLLEVPGPWPRDVSRAAPLDVAVRERVTAWLDADPGRRRLLFVRRPGATPARPLAFVVRAEESEAEVRRIELGRLDRLALVDLEVAGDLVDGPLVLVCGHGARDRCCALRGTVVYGALDGQLRAEELWISSHQGGHRFAANVLVLPLAVQLGRVTPADAHDVVGRALEGRIALDLYRGRTCYEPALQAAEHAVRSSAGIERVDELWGAHLEASLARFRGPDGSEHRAVVQEVEGPSLPASCGTEPEPQRRLVARVL